MSPADEKGNVFLPNRSKNETIGNWGDWNVSIVIYSSVNTALPGSNTNDEWRQVTDLTMINGEAFSFSHFVSMNSAGKAKCILSHI